MRKWCKVLCESGSDEVERLKVTVELPSGDILEVCVCF